MAIWNSRFKKPLHPEALKYSSSIETDGRLYREDVEGSIAHVKMLVRCGIISREDGKAIVKGLAEIKNEIESGKLKFDWQKEDIHSLIEERLVEKIGSRGKRLHTARSRNDQVALDERLFLRKEIKELIKLIRALQKAFLKQALVHKNTIVSGYTHLQRAQPLLLAHHLLAYISMFERDIQRLEDLQKRANSSPLGAAALAGSTLPIDRNYTAKLLGMDGIVLNSIDAVSDRDTLIEFISCCSIVMMHLSRFSEELVLWSSSEFSFVTLDDGFATGSSLMPQKKNPDLAELIRGKVGRVYGALTGILTVMKALPLAYNRDMQEDKIHLLQALDTTKESVQIATLLLSHIHFNKDRFRDELDGDYSLSTELVDYLVRKNVPFRKAHQIVGAVVALAVARGVKLSKLTMEDYKKVSQKFEKDLFDALSVESSIKKKISAGSTSFNSVGNQLNFWRKKLKYKK